ncbi:LAMP5 protein, partial [Columbina picui]|nr:LAMP5 protein [Columbina picui]
LQLITEQADIPLSRGAEMKGKCGTNESELEISWLEQAYTLKLFFVKEGHNTSRGQEAFWRLSRIQFTYDTSERTYFKDAVTRKCPEGTGFKAHSRDLGPLAQSDDSKEVHSLLQQFRFAMSHSFPSLSPSFSSPAEHKCPVDQREQLEETLPLILGLILGLVIVITLCAYHIHHKLTANQVQIPRDRSQYKHMG